MINFLNTTIVGQGVNGPPRPHDRIEVRLGRNAPVVLEAHHGGGHYDIIDVGGSGSLKGDCKNKQVRRPSAS